ncbi:hypothetical protein, partial [Acinetobacter gandensis]|uniref:hypothetical protein n=1 Tax=Acinetobacter gandensis TaxID=1443941 RepID=UPI003F551A03
IRSTTYPSYALNLAQLGALCISNLCATKPYRNNHVLFFDGFFLLFSSNFYKWAILTGRF